MSHSCWDIYPLHPPNLQGTDELFDVTRSSALTSPLPSTENCRRPRCRQPRSWRRPNTKFKLCKQVWPCGFCALSQVVRWEVRGQGWLGVPGLGVKQLWTSSRAQLSFVNQSKHIGKYRDRGAHTESEHAWNYSRHGTLTPCVFCFHTFPNCDKYLGEPRFLPVAMPCC